MFGKKKKPAPEEIEALDHATRVLQWRVAQMTKTPLMLVASRAAT